MWTRLPVGASAAHLMLTSVDTAHTTLDATHLVDHMLIAFCPAKALKGSRMSVMQRARMVLCFCCQRARAARASLSRPPTPSSSTTPTSIPRCCFFYHPLLQHLTQPVKRSRHHPICCWTLVTVCYSLHGMHRAQALLHCRVPAVKAGWGQTGSAAL